MSSRTSALQQTLAGISSPFFRRCSPTSAGVLDTQADAGYLVPQSASDRKALRRDRLRPCPAECSDTSLIERPPPCPEGRWASPGPRQHAHIVPPSRITAPRRRASTSPPLLPRCRGDMRVVRHAHWVAAFAWAWAPDADLPDVRLCTRHSVGSPANVGDVTFVPDWTFSCLRPSVLVTAPATGQGC